MRNFLSTLTVLSLSLWMSPANAVFTFSNVSYTANSVTFTIDGNMSGYGAGGFGNQFSLVYSGDIWVGDENFESNSWNREVFDNKTFSQVGNTGTSGNSYTWSAYTSSLDDAAVSNATITVTFSEPDLDESAENPGITFVWGNGSNPEYYKVLGSWGFTGNVPPSTPVPTLSQWASIVLTLLLGMMVFANRRRFFQ